MERPTEFVPEDPLFADTIHLEPISKTLAVITLGIQRNGTTRQVSHPVVMPIASLQSSLRHLLDILSTTDGVIQE